MTMHSGDPGRYGASFADVYDLWYPGGDERELCDFLVAELTPGARILELGVGTGRVALAMVAAGFEVVGLDASSEMLDALANKTAPGSGPASYGPADCNTAISAVKADAGAPQTWAAAGIDGQFDCVLAACNLLLNLTAPGAQQSCVAGAADLLAPGGVLITELSLIDVHNTGRTGVEVSSVRSDGVVLVVTETEAGTGLVEGRHIELLDGEPVRVRPWSIRAMADGDLDRWCTAAGLTRASSHGGWDRSPCGPDDAVLISVHAHTPH